MGRNVQWAKRLETWSVFQYIVWSSYAAYTAPGPCLAASFPYTRSTSDYTYTLILNCIQIYLAPDEHAAEDDLEAVEEVVTDYDDCCSTGSPTFIRTDRFDRRRRRTQKSYKLNKWVSK